MKAVKQTKPQLNSLILENKKVIKKYYNDLAESSSDYSLFSYSQDVISKLIDILGYVNDQSEQLLLSFQKLVSVKHSSGWPKFKEFILIVNTWVTNNKILTIREMKAQENIIQHLEKSIKQYQVLCKTAKDPEEAALSKQVLDLLISSKKKVRAVYKKEEPKFSDRTECTPQEIKSVTDIFNFYAKQHIMAGKNPTFDMLGEIVGNMDSGSYLHFCKHFELCTKKKVEGKRYLVKDEILKIFKHCSTLQKSMNLQGFTSSLDQIAELYFNEEYERLVPFKCSSLPIERKRIMLYEILKLDNPRHVNKTCMPIRTPFGPTHDKIIKPTITKKAVPNDEEVKEQINLYKKERNQKQIIVNDERGKEAQEKQKKADMKIREKKDQEDLKKRKDIFRMEDLEKGKYQDFDENKDLEDLIAD